MRIAVFDLDGTLSRRDLFLAFLAHAVRRMGPARPLRAATLPVLTARYALRGITNDRLKAAYLDAVLGGRTRAAVESLAETFAERAVTREMKPAALAALQRHRRAGDRLVLASASLDAYVAPIARRLGFDDAVATRIAWTADGRVAGSLDGPNLRGPAKLDAVRAVIAGWGEARVTAYSDHESDEALLAAAAEAVAVDPSPGLARIAAGRGWTVMRWGGADDPQAAPAAGASARGSA
jgi:HAD superfamily hydrolase (TIGR01490 family)